MIEETAFGDVADGPLYPTVLKVGRQLPPSTPDPSKQQRSKDLIQVLWTRKADADPSELK